MATYQPTVFSTGHQFLEAPRWHDGKFWASDFFSEQVLTFTEDGTATPITKVPGRPSGLGFLPDGTPPCRLAERAVGVSHHRRRQARAVCRLQRTGWRDRQRPVCVTGGRRLCRQFRIRAR